MVVRKRDGDEWSRNEMNVPRYVWRKKETNGGNIPYNGGIH